MYSLHMCYGCIQHSRAQCIYVHISLPHLASLYMPLSSYNPIIPLRHITALPHPSTTHHKLNGVAIESVSHQVVHLKQFVY